MHWQAESSIFNLEKDDMTFKMLRSMSTWFRLNRNILKIPLRFKRLPKININNMVINCQFIMENIVEESKPVLKTLAYLNVHCKYFVLCVNVLTLVYLQELESLEKVQLSSKWKLFMKVDSHQKTSNSTDRLSTVTPFR